MTFKRASALLLVTIMALLTIFAAPVLGKGRQDDGKVERAGRTAGKAPAKSNKKKPKPRKPCIDFTRDPQIEYLRD
jgi:hypothetical protein